MNFQRFLAAGILVAMVTLAGCVPGGDTTNISYYGSMNGTNSTFEMNGYLIAEGGTPEQEVFRNVTVELHYKNGSLISSTEIGDLPASDELSNISIRSSTVPYYVVFNSRDFWKEKTFVVYYELYENGPEYDLERVASKNELPVKTHNKPNNTSK